MNNAYYGSSPKERKINPNDIKNVPCSECTQCGETYFDDEVAEHLEYIVNSLKSVVAEITVIDYEAKVA